MIKKVFDYLVLGGGSGGLASARRAAKYGKKVGLIESHRLGGTCVNLGCVPKKVMWYASSFLEDSRVADSYGFTVKLSHSFETLKKNRDAYVARLNGIYENNLVKDKIEFIKGFGQLINRNQIKVNDDVYEASHILLSPGSRPVYPSIPGGEYLMSSDQFFELKSVPSSVLIIGNGYIAAELAGIFNTFSVPTTLSIRGSVLLKFLDHDISSVLQKHYLNSGIQILENSVIKSISKTENGFKVHFEGFSQDFGAVFAATGREANLNFGLESAGVKVENNCIWTDEFFNTSVSNIYAVGDVTENAKLTPVAIMTGRKLADRIFAGKDGKVDLNIVPTVIFSHPPIGYVGLTEAQARENFEKVKVYKSEFNGMYFAMSQHKIPCFLKLVCVGDEERVVGLHGIGKFVDEIIQGFAVGIKMGATKKDFDATIAIHPTIGEEFVTMT